jgi:hypothetical protein
MGKFGKFIGRLIAFGVFAAWFTFSIWGIAYWNNPPSFIDNQKTMVVLYVPMFIGMFILFIIVMAIGAISRANKKRKDKKKEKDGVKIEGLKDLEKLEDVKDWEEFKAMIPDKWKEKFKEWSKEQ